MSFQRNHAFSLSFLSLNVYRHFPCYCLSLSLDSQIGLDSAVISRHRPDAARLIAAYTFARQGRCERSFLSAFYISHAAPTQTKTQGEGRRRGPRGADKG